MSDVQLKPAPAFNNVMFDLFKYEGNFFRAATQVGSDWGYIP